MSLEQLRAEVEKEEQEATSTEEETKDELELADDSQDEEDAEEGSSEEESEDEEAESTDFELTLDGEPEPGRQKHDPEDALVYKLTREKKKRQSVQDEKDKLAARVAELEARLNGPSPSAQPVKPVTQANFPDLYDKGIDGDRQKLDQAVKQWWADFNASKEQEAQQAAQSQEYQKAFEAKQLKLAKAAAEFAKTHKINGDRVVEAVQRAHEEFDAAVQGDGALVHLLDAVGEGSERVAYYLGTNEQAMAEAKRWIQEDPTGLTVGPKLTRLAMRLKPKQSKQISSAPEPDEALRGDGASKSQRKLQAEYDKAASDGDITAVRAIRKKADRLGVKLD